jgi:signal transduction histidine kinase
VVDKRYSLTVELKDDTKELPSTGAIGLASYSNSLPTVLSYISVFDTLRKQTELLEKLKIHDKIQQEFINIAAHELRNPIQPILGLSNHLINRKGRDKEEKELLETINRNAKRLQKLTESILDVTKIESRSLKLNKEKSNLNNLILDIVKNYKNYIDKTKNIKFEFNNFNNNININIDKNRISQVITNLISNSVKFIDKQGDISISINKRKKNANNNNEIVIFSIKDNGIGIDKEIMPKLFTKFTTKSFQGTGLGLYISKNIIEAHGGQIWAEDNKDEKGATFSFSLPL